jgi:hypothetical protein
MGIILILMIGMVGFLVLFFWFILGYSNRMVRLLVESRHRDAEFILSSRMPPPDWKSRLLVRFGPAAAKWYALRRVKIITNYFQRTPFVDSEEVRRAAVDDLEAVRKEWRGKTWNEIFPYR